jgi:hypothetical protein
VHDREVLLYSITHMCAPQYKCTGLSPSGKDTGRDEAPHGAIIASLDNVRKEHRQAKSVVAEPYKMMDKQMDG